MSNIVIQEQALAEAKATSKELKTAVSQSLATIKSLQSISTGNNRTWTGESKAVYLMYLDILIQSHEKLEKAVKLQDQAIKDLAKHIQDVHNGDTMSGIRRI